MDQRTDTWECKPIDSKAEVVVIGVGNAYRGDDGVGPFIASKLKPKTLPRTLVKCQTGEGTSLMESWSDADTSIIIDAANSGASPGKIYRFDVHGQSIPSRVFNYSSHNFSVAEAVELARALDRLPTRLIIYGVEGKSFQEGVTLSPEVQEAAVEVIKKVTKDIYDRRRMDQY